MGKLLETLRGARRLELFAAIVILALLGLQLLGGGAGVNTGPQGSELERRLERLLSEIDGAGGVRVMVSEAEDGRATGAVVIADGLRDVRTYLKLQGAVQTLLDVELSQIRIIGGGGFGE